ncbi:hypothetical protein [Streptomyces sp. NPDC002250]|uniref:hypothetical protein n=2 Tax=unclassified Streptomyces TaxID=2593676 RepID=UPI0036AA1967
MDALQAAPLGGQFTFRGRTYTRQNKDSSTPFRAYDESGRRLHPGLLEERAFWAWATIDFLQHTGVRIEEMLEASHHALIQYKLPTIRRPGSTGRAGPRGSGRCGSGPPRPGARGRR